MKRLKIWILVFITCLITLACEAQPILNFNPPLGRGWILAKNNKYGVYFRKPTSKGKYHSIIAVARLISNTDNIKTIAKLIKYAERSYQSNTRFRLLDLKSSIVNYNGRECVRVNFTSEDHGVPDVPADTAFTMKGYDYYWFNPDNPEFIIKAGYSQRYLPKDKPKEGIEEEVEPFLKSIIVIASSGKETFLIKASKKGDRTAVEELLAKGVDLNARGLTSDWCKTALMEASQRGHTYIVQALVNAGADVSVKDMFGDTALMFAAERGHVNIVRLLLDAGANANAQNTNYGSTPLMIAARTSNVEIANILLNAGADVNVKDNEGGTSLIISAGIANSTTIVQALIKSGADINAKDKRGRTPLIRAATSGNTPIVQLLIENGADVNSKSILKLEQGIVEITPLKLAKQKGYTEILELLKKADARE